MKPASEPVLGESLPGQTFSLTTVGQVQATVNPNHTEL